MTLEDKEALYKNSTFEWIKTERKGEISKFLCFDYENGQEFLLFEDGSKLNTNVLGEVMLRHDHESLVLGEALHEETFVTGPIVNQRDSYNNMIAGIPFDDGSAPLIPAQIQAASVNETPLEQKNVFAEPSDPVISILEKAKKKQEKISVNFTVNIPSKEIYSIIKENFENTDEIILNDIMSQISQDVLRIALGNELKTIYSKKRKKTNES